MSAMAAILLSFLAQPETIDALLRRFSDDDPSRRDEATKAIVERWKEWKDADLGKLRKAGDDPEQELAGRAREAFTTIRLRRRLGEAVLRELPDLEKAIRNGSHDQRCNQLVHAAIAWKTGKLDEGQLRVIAAIATEDGWKLEAEERRCLGCLPEVGILVPPYSTLVAPVLKDPDPEERTKAASLLGVMKAREHASDVAALLKNVDKSPRVAALKALAEMGARDYIPAIAGQLDPTEAYEIKLAAIEALGRLGAADAYAAKIVPHLQDGAPDLVRAAVDALGHAGVRGQAAAVAQLLKSDSLPTRMAALDVLGRMGATELAPAVAAVLREPDLRASAIEALGRMGVREQADAVAAFLKDPEGSVRNEAARALGRMGAADRAADLLPLLDDPSNDVRWTAIHSLGTLLTPETSEAVAKLLRSDTHFIRGLAANILGRIGAVERADAIAQLLDEGQPFVRLEAAKALAAIGSTRHRKAIVPLLEDEFEEVRTDSALALGEMVRVPPVGAERDLVLKGLEEATQSLTSPAQHAARVALALHGKDGRAGQVAVLKGVRESGQEYPEALFDGLAWEHEKPSFEKLSRPIALDRAVDSMARVHETLASVGLHLEGADSVQLRGRIPPGTRTTARRLLQELWETKYVIPRGDGVRLLARDEAYEAWEARLAPK
jgi:HEAT repeat protein